MTKQIFLKRLVFVIVFIIVFSVKGYGNGLSEDKYILYYYSNDSLVDQWESIEFVFHNKFSQLEKIEFLFSQFFNNEHIDFIPEGTKLIDVKLIDKELIINVTNEINHHGGTYYEEHLINQLVRTGLSIPNVNYVTLHIDGKLMYLNEGLYINKRTNWNIDND